MTELIRVLVADDHHVVRRGLASLLVPRNQMTLVGEAANGREVVELARTLQPDVIVIDLLMPELGGIEAIKLIMQEQPAARILVLSSFGEPAEVQAAIRAGAYGYLLKAAPPSELLQAIRAVYEGQLTLPHALALALVQTPPSPPVIDQLTEREMAVLRLLAEGQTNQEIAHRLMISDTTVRAHVSSILAKLKVANRTQAALFAREHLGL